MGDVKPRKIPMRTCMGCNTTRPKKELVRIVRLVNGELMIDHKGKVSGRGAYVCPEVSCVRQAIKTRRLERSLQVQVTDDVQAALEDLVNRKD